MIMTPPYIQMRSKAYEVKGKLWQKEAKVSNKGMGFGYADMGVS
jgi:hypothetical protein